jgi:hypothetical protein
MTVRPCRLCAGRLSAAVLDLGTVPVGPRLLPCGESAPAAPLAVGLCEACGLLQLLESLELQGASWDAEDAWHAPGYGEWLTRTLCRRYQLRADDVLVEFAGRRPGASAPSGERPLPAGLPRRHTCAADLDEVAARELARRVGPVRLALGLETLSPSTDVPASLAAVRALLAPDGVAVFETPYAGAIHEKVAFDVFHPGRRNYFTLRAAVDQFPRHGLAVIDAERTAVHGGSLLLHVARADGPRPPHERVASLLDWEEAHRLASPETWQAFARRAAGIKEDLWGFLREAARFGQALAGYGVPPRLNSLLTYLGLTSAALPYIVDHHPENVGLVTAAGGIPVRGRDHWFADNPDVTFVLDWEHADAVVRREKEYRQRGGRLAVPAPLPGLYSVAA